MSPDEKRLVQLIYQYPQVLAEAGENYSPALVANYGYELAKAYNHFYHDHVIVDSEQPDVTAFRLALSDMTAMVIKKSMELLGIKVPDRM
jgi:arginyl-tRNA synthetase